MNPTIYQFIPIRGIHSMCGIGTSRIGCEKLQSFTILTNPKIDQFVSIHGIRCLCGIGALGMHIGLLDVINKIRTR